MMSLLESTQNLMVRFTKIDDARNGIAETQALDGLLSELNSMAQPIGNLAANARLLEGEGINLSIVPEVQSTIGIVLNILTRFSEEPKSSTLKGTRWSGLTKKLVSLASQLEEKQVLDWKTFFDNNLFSGVRPEQRRGTLALTPENKKMLERYTNLYQSFIQYKVKIPKNADEFCTLKSLSDQLAQIKFQDNVPDDVKKFLEAISIGAGLELLTNDVLIWLRSNSMIGNYIIRAKN